jgi:hypothetical protein
MAWQTSLLTYRSCGHKYNTKEQTEKSQKDETHRR